MANAGQSPTWPAMPDNDAAALSIMQKLSFKDPIICVVFQFPPEPSSKA
jgi:hypothetical protein